MSSYNRVEKIKYDFIQRQVVFKANSALIEISHLQENSALFAAQIHNLPQIVGRRINVRFDYRFFHMLYLRNGRQVGRIIHENFLPVRLYYLIAYRRRGCYNFKSELALDAFLNYFHM